MVRSAEGRSGGGLCQRNRSVSQGCDRIAEAGFARPSGTELLLRRGLFGQERRPGSGEEPLPRSGEYLEGELRESDKRFSQRSPLVVGAGVRVLCARRRLR